MDKVNLSVAIIPMSHRYGWSSSTAGLVQSLIGGRRSAGRRDGRGLLCSLSRATDGKASRRVSGRPRCARRRRPVTGGSRLHSPMTSWHTTDSDDHTWRRCMWGRRTTCLLARTGVI